MTYGQIEYRVTISLKIMYILPYQVTNNGNCLRHLRADCRNCFGLCCVALTYARSADFAFVKERGIPCPNLQPDDRCGIHTDLRKKGSRGCAVYKCFGAGQKVSQVTYEGND